MDGRFPLRWVRPILHPFRLNHLSVILDRLICRSHLNRNFRAVSTHWTLVAVTHVPKPVSYGLPADVKKIFAVEKTKRDAGAKEKLITV